MPTDAPFWSCFCCISTLLLGACSSEVRRGIDEPAANEMVVALHRAGIAADKLRDEGTSGAAAYRVDVAKSDLPRALSLLERAGLPRRTPQGVADVFGEPSLVPTKGEEDARWALAIGGELSRTLGAMDGVVHARVHLAVAPSRLSLVDTPSRASSASVLVTHRGRTPPISSDRIQALVAGAVPGLSADAVAVVFAKAPVSAEQHAAPLERVGPFSVTAGSAPWVRVAFSVAIGVQAALAAALLFVLKRRSLGRTSESA